MAKFKYSSRKFLNKKTGLAAIECKVDSWDYGDNLDGSIQITDCNRAVSLDFGIYDGNDLAEKYIKLTLFMEEIQKMHKYLTDNYEAIAEAMKKKEEARKERKKKKYTVKVVDDAELQ